jgi:hypothetical protein
MKNILIKLYDLLTAPIYRRLARDLTVQLQEISQSYIDQHERLTAKIVDELVRLNIRVGEAEGRQIAKDLAFEQLEAPICEPEAMSAEQIWELMNEASRSIDVVEICAKHKIPLSLFFELESKYRSLETPAIRRMKLLEDTNIELRSLVTTLMHQQSLTTSTLKNKVANGNGRD